MTSTVVLDSLYDYDVLVTQTSHHAVHAAVEAQKAPATIQARAA